MGVDSGLPDFRSTAGLWRTYPALADLGMNFATVASPETFRGRPELAWGFYGHRLELYRKTLPHRSYSILRRWVGTTTHGAFVYTSNVDQQFQAAGYPDERIHECHGSVHWLQCLQPCCDSVWPAATLQPRVDQDSCHWLGQLPRCPYCGGLARPNVLMFRDGDWQDRRYDLQFERLARWLEPVRRLVVIEIGAGTEVTTVRHLSEHMVQQFGARLVRINPTDSAVSNTQDVGLATGALKALAAIDELLTRL